MEKRKIPSNRILRFTLSLFIAGLFSAFWAGAAPLTPEKDVTVVNKENHTPQWKELWDEARDFSQKQDFDNAIERYLEVLEIKPHIEAVRWELSRTYLVKQDYDKALVILQGLLEVTPGKTDYLVSAGEAALQQQKPELAARYFGQGLAAHPDGPLSQVALRGMVDALWAQDKSGLAIPLMEQLFRRGEIDPGLLRRLARSYVKREDFQNGAFYYRELIAKYRVDAAVLYEASLVYEEVAAFEEAADLWERYLEAHPDRNHIRIKLADFYLANGARQDALPHMLYLIEHDIDSDRYLLPVARTYLYEQGRTDRALYYFEEYRKDFPDGIDVSDEITGLQIIIANDLLAIVENDGAWRLWQDLALVTPDRIGIYRAMVEMFRDMGKEKETELIEILKIIYAHQPDDIETISQLVAAYKKTGRISECTEFMDRAESLNKERAEFHLLRAECDHAAGDDRDRLRSYTSYLKLVPKDQEVALSALRLAGALGLVKQLDQIHNNFKSADSASLISVDYSYASELLRNGLARKAEAFLEGFEPEKEDLSERMLLARKMAALDLTQNRPYKAEQRVREYGANSSDPLDGFLLLADFFIRKNAVYSAGIWHDAIESSSRSMSASQKSIKFYQSLRIDRALTKVNVYQRALTYLNRRLKSNRIIGEDVDILLFSARNFLETNRFEDCIRLINRFHQNFIGVDSVAAILVIAQKEKAGRNSSWADIPLDTVSLSIRMAVAEQLTKLGRFEDAETVLLRVAAELPESTRLRVLLADVHMAMLAYGEAGAIYKDLSRTWEQESFFSEQLFRIENLQGRAELIFKEFNVGIDDSGRKNTIVTNRESLDYTELKLMWARSLWSADEWEASLDVYGLLDTEMKRTLDRMVEGLKRIPLDSFPPELTDAVGRGLTFDDSEMIELIMSHEFVAENLNGIVAKTSSRYFDAYRWGTIIGKELTAKSSLKAGEFYQAELDYKNLLQEEAEVMEPIYSDLATVYGRLGRYREETQLLEKIKETNVYYPELSQITEKNIRRRQPQLSVEGSYREEEGRDGAIDSIEQSAGVGLQVRPSLYQDVGLLFTHSQYGNSDSSSLVDSNTLLGNYRIQISDTIEGSAKLGVEDFSEDGDTLLLYDLMLRGTLEQRVELYGGVKQEPVDDTVDALLEGLYRRDIQVGFSLDYFFGMFFGFDIDFLDYSDENEGERYYLWSSYRWFGERTAVDLTYSYLNLQHELTNELAEEAGAGYEIPYWSPGDYWKHRLSAMYKMELWPTGRLQSGTGSFSALYGIGYEKGDSLVHEIDLNILLEITASFLVKGTLSTTLSDDYDQLKGYLSLIYRW